MARNGWFAGKMGTTKKEGSCALVVLLSEFGGGSNLKFPTGLGMEGKLEIGLVGHMEDLGF